MSIRQKQRSSVRALFKIRDSVSFELGPETATGVITEDRGTLGAGGRRLYRVLVAMNPGFPEEDMIFEMPEDEIWSSD